MSDFELTSDGIKIPGEVFTSAYNDVIHPGLSAAGKTIALPFRAINWIAEVASNYCVDKMKNTQKLQECVQEKLSNTPIDKLCEPPKNIAVPAIISNSYTDDDELRSMYANLLANSMKKDTQSKSHPSFVEVIRQLTPDEALILKTSEVLTDGIPSCQIRYQFKTPADKKLVDGAHPKNIIRELAGGVTIIPYYLPSIKSVNQNELQIMIDNFIRLNLIKAFDDYPIMCPNAYINFYKDAFNKELENTWKERFTEDYELAHIPTSSAPTAYGERFYDVCVE